MASHDVLHTLNAEGFREACRQTHPLWHQGLGPEAYAKRLEEAFVRMAGEMRYVGLRADDGSLAASARLLQLRMRVGAETVPACGIAAVFANEACRGRGWGARLIRAILADASLRGQRLALLFSDIGTGYYERLGFRAFPARDWIAPVDAIPLAEPLTVREGGEADRLLALFNAHADCRAICPKRSPAWWAYFRWWRSAKPDLALLDGGREVGYATVRHDPDHLHVFEWVAPDVPAERVWTTLRMVALRTGQRMIGGWMQPTRNERWMQVADRRDAIPMVADTSGGASPYSTDAVFEELDHF